MRSGNSRGAVIYACSLRTSLRWPFGTALIHSVKAVRKQERARGFGTAEGLAKLGLPPYT